MATVASIGRAAPVASATQLAERLYDRHHGKVYAFCLYQLRDRDDAAEAAQTTYLHALGALRRGVDPAFELPWLISIARNVCRSRWDAGKRRRRIELVRDPHDIASLAAAHEPTELVGIEDALAALPEPQRRALVLREWHGLSYQEIADELGLSLSAVETLIFRGRKALAQELGADENGKRSFGIGSLLGSIKSGVGGGLTAKVAVGVVAAVGVSVAASQELTRPAHAPGRAPVVSVQPQAVIVHARVPSAVRSTRNEPTRVRAVATRKAVRARVVRATAPVRTRPGKTAAPPTAGTATPPEAAAPPSVTDGTPTAPAAATPPPSGAAPTPTPAADPAPPAPPPAAPAVTPSQPAVEPVVAQVADTATDATAPVVTTVTTAAAPVVTTVTDAATPVVSTVTNATTPVVSTVTNALPPVQAPTVTVPQVHLP